MRRVTFPNSRGLSLAGHLYEADSKSVVVLAHGFTNDKSSNGRFERIATALNDARYWVLTFDFSGSGESEDDTLNIPKQVDDLLSAVDFVQARGLRRIALFGNSLGGLICLKAYSARIATMVLTGPPTAAIQYRWESYFSGEQLRELKNRGYLTVNCMQGTRKQIIVEAELLDSFERIDQRELLSQVHCPVLIIHGDTGEEERALLERSQTGLTYLPAESRLEVIPGAEHGLRDHVDRVIALSLTWLDYLGAAPGSNS